MTGAVPAARAGGRDASALAAESVAVPGPADDPIAYARTVLDHAAYRARQAGRADLVERLEAQRVLLDDGDRVVAVVVGLCDAGKTTLVNACVGATAVPVDLVHPTPAPVAVHRAEELAVAAHGADHASPPRLVGADELPALLAAGSPGGLTLVDIGLPAWERARGLVLVDTPSASLGRATTDPLLQGAEPDVVVLATDAAQELSEIELAAVAAAERRGCEVIVALTKVDLHVDWRRIRAVDERHLARAAVRARVVPVSARLHELGRAQGDDALLAEGGLAPLLAVLDQAGADTLAARAAARALATVVEVTETLEAELAARRNLLVDPAAAASANLRLTELRDRVERLRGAGAKWRERLFDGLERLQLATDHDLRTRLAKLQAQALEEVDSADPGAIWPVFAARLERLAESEVSEVFAALDDRAGALAADVARLFGDECGPAAVELGAATGTTSALPEGVRMQSRLENPESEHGGAILNAIRGSAASVSVTAIITRYGALVVGGALLQTVLLPVGAAITLLLGHRTMKATREAQLQTRRRAAGLAVRKYLDGIGPEVAVRVRSELMSTRVGLRDHFDQAAITLQSALEAEFEVTVASLRATEGDRQHQLAALDEDLRQVELVEAHARRAATLLGLPVAVPAG